MVRELQAPYFSFDEAGVSFEGYCSEGGPWWLGVKPSGGEQQTLEFDDFKSVCGAVDSWLAREVALDHPGRFRGLKLTIWDCCSHA